ncbi:MAG: glycosyltransferase [Lachnospiraceae bacterium]
MKISVILACYNGEKVIEEQLESLLWQTREIDEVMIQDDCSTDQTVKVVQSFLEKHHLEDKWSVEINVRNNGYSSNFMQAAWKSTGDVLFFCDQDDIWKADKVEVMANEMESSSYIQVLTTEYQGFCGNFELEDHKEKTQKYKLKKIAWKQKNIFLQAPGCTMCVTRSFLNKVKHLWFAGWAHDEFVWKAALCSQELYHLEYVGIYRRFHEGNTSGKKLHQYQLRYLYLTNLKKSYERMYGYIRQLEADDRVSHLMKRNIKAVFWRLRVIENGDIKAQIRLLTMLDTYYKKRAWLTEFLIGFNKQNLI